MKGTQYLKKDLASSPNQASSFRGFADVNIQHFRVSFHVIGERDSLFEYFIGLAAFNRLFFLSFDFD